MKKSVMMLGLLAAFTIQPGVIRADHAEVKQEAATTDRKAGIRRRTEEDRKTYTAEQLREIETLYQVANKQWNTQEAKDSLKTLIKKYPKANRTGCAVQYMGQMASGEEKEKYLKLAIKEFGDCFYGSGVQVGAYARLYLGHYYKGKGMEKEAKALFDEIRKDYPDAVNHKGKRLVEMLPK
jgi:TolA-binding protein